MPDKDAQHLYSVEVIGSENDSQYLFRASDPETAAGLYLQEIIDGNISVCSGTVHERDELRVITLPDRDGPSGLVSWEGISTITLNASEHPVWIGAIAEGFDPEEGLMIEDGPEPD